MCSLQFPGFFDSEIYPKFHNDVKDAKTNPLVYYLKWGKKEFRIALPINKVSTTESNQYNYLKTHADINWKQYQNALLSR